MRKWLRAGVAGGLAVLLMVAVVACATNLTDLELSGTLSVDTIAEMTSGSGVTVDGLTIKDTGFADDFTLTGTTPQFTIGDAGAEDTALVYDGNAQDFYIALDDSADDLLIGLGATVGTTGIVYLDENQDVGLGGASAGAKLDVTGNVLIDGAADEIQLTAQGFTTQTTSILVLEQSTGTDVLTVANSGNTDILGTLQYGANNLYPVGHASSGLQAVYGTALITGTATAAHGLTTVTFCLATLGEDPTAGAGDAAHVSVAVSANVCTLKAWQDDFVTAATETNVDVHWLVIGTP